MKFSQRGSATLVILVLSMLIGMAIFIYYLSHLPNQRVSANIEPGPDTSTEKKTYELQGDLFKLYTSLDGFEAMKNRRKYLQVLQSAERKLMQLDSLWDAKSRKQNAVFDGMRSGLNEYYEVRFTPEEKLQILSRKFGLPVNKLRRLKANLEIMFTEELAEKFAPAEEPQYNEATPKNQPQTSPDEVAK